MRRVRTWLSAVLGLSLASVLGTAVVAPAASAQAGQADMAVAVLTQSGGSIVAGGTTNLNLVFENRGPGNAPGARATVTWNQSVQVTITSVSRGSCSGGGSITCNAGNLNDGQRVTVQATVRLGGGAQGNMVATARANSDANDPNGGNDQRQSALPIGSQTDLALSQSISPNPPQAGGNATVRPVVTNRGPSNARDVVLIVNIPAGVSLVSAPGCAGGGSRLTCNLGNVAVGASAGAQVTYGLAGLPAGSRLTAAASVRSSTQESNNGNNSLSQSFTIGAATADLSVQKSASPGTVSVGGVVTFAISVANAGPSEARGVVVNDAVPAGLRVRSTGGSGDCSTLGQTVICNLGTLGAGEGANVVITATVLPGVQPGTYVNRVSVNTSTADRNPGNNAAEASIRVAGSTVTTSRPPRPTVRPTQQTVDPTSTTLGELPATGSTDGAPVGAAAILIGLGVAAWAISFRLRGAPD